MKTLFWKFEPENKSCFGSSDTDWFFKAEDEARSRTSVRSDSFTSTVLIVSLVKDETINVFRQTGVKSANHMLSCSIAYWSGLESPVAAGLLSSIWTSLSSTCVCPCVCPCVCVCGLNFVWTDHCSGASSLTVHHRAWLSPEATRTRGGIKLINESLAEKVQLDWTRGASLLLLLLLDFTWEGNKTQEPNLWPLHLFDDVCTESPT